MYRCIQFESLAAKSSLNHFEYSCELMHKLHYFCCFATAKALRLYMFTAGVTLTICHVFSAIGT